MKSHYYQAFEKALKEVKFQGQYVPYDFPGPQQRSLPFEWLAYDMMRDEFARELANVVNALTSYTHRLAAWDLVLSGIPEDERHGVVHEFVEPIATTALLMPYAIRSRFIFAAAHLCHQANQLKRGKDWKDDLAMDKDIYFEVADKEGAHWKRYAKLKLALEKIANKKHQAGTLDFRHSWSHRFSPRVVVGYTQALVRTVEAGKVSYSIGGLPPMSLAHVVATLREECEKSYKAFDAFRKLVEEQLGEIHRSLPELAADGAEGHDD